MPSFKRPSDLAYESSDEERHAGDRPMRPRWGLLLALAALLVGVAMPSAIWGVDRIMDARSRQATLAIDETFRRESPGNWTLVITVTNTGGGTIPLMSVVMTATNALCFEAQLSEDEEGFVEVDKVQIESSGAACEGGSELVAGGAVPQSEVPVPYVRLPESEGLAVDIGLYSATAENLQPNQILWFEFTFLLHPTLDADFAAADADPLTIQSIARFSVTGDGVATTDPSFDISTVVSPP